MEKSVYKSGSLLALAAVCLLSFSLSAQEIKKDFHQEFKAGTATTLEINNRYGDVVVQGWNKDQIVVDVKVTVEMSDKSRAAKLLGYINIKFSQEGDHISAKTVIDDNFNFSGWGGSRRFSIDYSVKMPTGANLDLTNKYGNTDIDELHGLVTMDVKYGDVSADKLTRGNEKPLNKLSLAYGKGSIDEAGWLDIYARYSPSISVDKSQALLLDSKYSKVKIGETSSLVGESKYDNVSVEEIKNIVLQSGYTSTKIGTVTKKINFQGSYGSFDVNIVPAGFESIDVKTSYMGVKLGIEESASYILDAHSSYGSIKFNEDNFRHEKHIVENNSTTLSGTVGKEKEPKATVKVSASYGQIKLY
jgi:hypothetical protein